MPDEQIRIDVTATDDASKVLEDVADAAKDLERLEPEIPVTADTDQAERGIEDVADAAQALSRQDTEILLRAKIDDAKGALKALRDDLDQTGEKAQATARELDRVGGDDGGRMQTRGNAIADLTGPLGEASGAASDFAGVFDGIGDIAEDVAGKVGLNAAAMSTAIGGIGIAIAAAAALWTVFRQNQERAKARQRELLAGQRDINDAIREGDAAAAASSFNDLYGPDVITAANTLGVSIRDATDYITGNSDALQANIDKLREQGEIHAVIADGIENARREYADTNGTLAEQDQILAAVEESFKRTNRQTRDATSAQERLERQVDETKTAFDRMRGSLDMQAAVNRLTEQIDTALTNIQSGAEVTSDDVLGIKQSIIDVGEAAKANPIEVEAALQKIDDGDYWGAKRDAEDWFRANPVYVRSVLIAPTYGRGTRPDNAPQPASMAVDGGGPVIVNQSFPVGYRGDPVAAAHHAIRRTGRLYRTVGRR